ncbi:MAG: tetratricopeptide repeat protein [Parachlamydiaceae bacterium]|nr:tetratricopeptide repeat protein [Parachlamydiaceae bacterium]
MIKMQTKPGDFAKILLALLVALALCGCQTCKTPLEPQICYEPPLQLIETLPTSFPVLTTPDYRYDWAKELLMGNVFAHEQDYYRAITCYKRALILLPKKEEQRRQQIEYDIVLSYYLGKKYLDTINTFEASSLVQASSAFPAYRELLIMLYDAYKQVGSESAEAKACQILNLLQTLEPETAAQEQLSQAVIEADFTYMYSQESLPLANMLLGYETQAKSVQKARTLNALLPGAGYLYVGQKQAALTSFIINGLFIAAAYHFFSHKNIAAGAIVSSLEFGWYFGGINGAGLAATEYNERLYECAAKDFLINQKLFPVLLFQHAF